MLLWLSDRSQAATDWVKQYLLTHSAAGNDISGNPITVTASGLKKVYAGGKGKIAEHGGDDIQDRNVPILVVLPGLRDGHVISARSRRPRSRQRSWRCSA
jgi:hypothetical protein